MRVNKKMQIAGIVLILLLLVAGAMMLLRSPAPKPDVLPPAPIQEAQPQPPVQPIPGAKVLDVDKYKSEPVITVWIAEKNQIVSMPLEKYLEGVVAQEMDPTWPVEALAAQAIASRTLTINAMEVGTIKRLHKTDVSTSKEELQAYAPQKVNNNVRQAVENTRGQVLLYAGTLVNAIYHSCNGQIAATKEEAFPVEIEGSTPYFQPVQDNCLSYAPENIKSWTAKVSGSEVAAAVGYSGNPSDISIVEKGPSGRILFIGAGNKKIYGSEFRKRVGYDRLKSTLITEMTYQDGNFIFKGVGWGNGVGLCQWGAYGFVQQGRKAADIVTYYYPGAVLQKLYN